MEVDEKKHPNFSVIVFTSHEGKSEWLDQSRTEHEEHPCVSAISNPHRDTIHLNRWVEPELLFHSTLQPSQYHLVPEPRNLNKSHPKKKKTQQQQQQQQHKEMTK